MRVVLTLSVSQMWESCTSRLADLAQRLEELKVRLEKQPIQEMEEVLIKVIK